MVREPSWDLPCLTHSPVPFPPLCFCHEGVARNFMSSSRTELDFLTWSKDCCDIVLKLHDFDSYSQKTLYLEWLMQYTNWCGCGYLCMHIQHIDFDFSSVFQKWAFIEVHLLLTWHGSSVNLKGSEVACCNRRLILQPYLVESFIDSLNQIQWARHCSRVCEYGGFCHL